MTTGNHDAGTASRGADFAWKTHSAIIDWTGKVDSKASIVLSLGGVLLGFIVSLSTGQRLLDELTGRSLAIERVGLCFVCFGVGLSALVVAPRLNRRDSRRSWRNNFLYFGHLRRWDADSLESELAGLTEARELEVLAHQLVQTAKVAWFKHSCLQGAMITMVIGVLLLFISVIY